jgi:hypothetical protein
VDSQSGRGFTDLAQYMHISVHKLLDVTVGRAQARHTTGYEKY